jgi:transposase
LAGEAIEIITGRERWRRWSIEEKLRIVAESNEPGTRVTEVAVRHGVYPGLLFSWRRQVRDGVLAAAPPATFVPVRMLEPAQELSSEMVPAPKEVRTIASKPGRPAEPIEITLSNGCQLRIDPRVDARALRRIVDVLRG